ncbi:MAG: hypothetical protein AABX85_00045 [Nanoarchaeota archaeon]
MKNKRYILIALIAVFAIAMFSFGSVRVSALNATSCCEKTLTGLYCQNVPDEECSPNARKVPTSCESTSFCRPGVCYNTAQGTCLDNTPEIVCNANGGTWSATFLPQCELGCCILGDQAAFVTLTRCKYLSSTMGLLTNYNKAIKNEVQCVLQVQNQDRGACVYDFEFQRTCKFTTRDQCNLGNNRSSVSGEFFKDKLCSNDELGTNCAPTTKTTCVDGKDEVYFVDTCGNAANIYDASMVPQGNRTDKAFLDYWGNVKSKTESCTSAAGSANSKTCGNCNYLSGSICRASSSTNTRAAYGDYVCADLNCHSSSAGEKKHGESWCIYDDAGTFGKGNNAVGSRFYKHICINGEEVLEQCDDFRQQECIQDKIPTSQGDFSQAACRVNRWRDCSAQSDKQDCENIEIRDCLWRDDLESSNSSGNGLCIPKNSPGLKFWEGDEAKNICAQASVQCVVTFEVGLLGKEKCVSNCDCMTEDWKKQRIEICQSLGDCGPKVNWIGQEGYKSSYNYSIK